jgi:hypothetical protein
MQTFLWIVGRPISAFAAGAAACYLSGASGGVLWSSSPAPAGQVLFLTVFAWTLHGHPEALARSLYNRMIMILGQASARPASIPGLHLHVTSATSQSQHRHADDPPRRASAH